MLFSELAHAIHPYLMNDGDVPSFMRTIIQNLCDIPENEWYTKKDPSSELAYKDASLRKFYNTGPTKKLAKLMLSSPTRQNFIDFINFTDFATDENEIDRMSLIKAITPFTEKDIDENNVGDILFDLLELSLDYIVNPELENDRKINKATKTSNVAKSKYGPKLLEECNNTCSKPDCDHHLQTVASDNQSINSYEIIKISGNDNSYDNLLAFCHDCFSSYTLKHTKKDEQNLKKIKTLQSQISETNKILRTVDIERGIRHVIENLKNAKANDFERLNYKPVSVEKKVDPQKDIFLYTEVLAYVTQFYIFIDKNMKDAVRTQLFNDDLLRAQIKASYKKLENKKIPKDLIYQSLAERLKQITKQDIKYCYIVISYFIQSCEVFDAITK